MFTTMQCIEQIPTQLQIMFNCDCVEWDSISCCYNTLISDPTMGTFPNGSISYEELHSAWSDYEEDLIREDEYWADMWDDLLWMQKNS